MINLRQCVRLIPYYQEYEVWYTDNEDTEYKSILNSGEILETEQEKEHWFDLFAKYKNCPVEHILAGRAEIIHIYLKEGSLEQ